jgi:hypothetical protein
MQQRVSGTRTKRTFEFPDDLYVDVLRFQLSTVGRINFTQWVIDASLEKLSRDRDEDLGENKKAVAA